VKIDIIRMFWQGLSYVFGFLVSTVPKRTGHWKGFKAMRMI
jgi:hypothetical protein